MITYKERLSTLKENYLGDLLYKLESERITEIGLRNPPRHGIIDDDLIINLINVGAKSAGLQDRVDLENGVIETIWTPLHNLSIDNLTYILDEIDSGNYDIYE